MRIHHVGYAVKNIDTSVIEFEELGFIKQGEKVTDVKRKVEIQFMKSGDYLIELIAPVDETAPVNNILKKVGNGPYHICYATGDLEREIKELRAKGYVLMEPPSEAVAIGNRHVAFLFNKNIGVIELAQEGK